MSMSIALTGSVACNGHAYHLVSNMIIGTFSRCRRINIMDNVLNMMEKYANNLEKLISDRTQQLTEEQRKTDRLLHRMLPA